MGGSRSNSIKITDFKRPDLNRAQEPEDEVSQEADLKDKGLQKGWQFLKESVLNDIDANYLNVRNYKKKL